LILGTLGEIRNEIKALREHQSNPVSTQSK